MPGGNTIDVGAMTEIVYRYISINLNLSAAGSSRRRSPDVTFYTDIQPTATGWFQTIFQIQFRKHILGFTEVIKACGLHGAIDRLAEGHPYRGTGDHTAFSQISRAFLERFKWLEANDEVAEGLARAVLVSNISQRIQMPLLRRKAALARGDTLSELVIPYLERTGDAARAHVKIAIDHIMLLRRRDIQKKFAL